MQVSVINILIFLLFLLTFLISLPMNFLKIDNEKFILIISIIGIWRYGWLLFNIGRAVVYKKIYFAKIRKKADNIPLGKMPKYVYIIITTYRIPEDISTEVYTAAIREIINCTKLGINGTLIASVVEKSEELLVRNIWNILSPPGNAKLIINRLPGTGKRDALSVSFRTMLKYRHTLKESVVLLVDGDTILSENTVIKCLPLFSIFPKLGAATTDEDNILEEKNIVYKIYNRWYKLRFAQRDMYMASASLSHRVMTLTGRMSIYRGELFLDPEFPKLVQTDYIQHWRLGNIRFLTGDDKSTWFYVLKNGWDMLYIPDVRVYSKETPPVNSFIKGSVMLMMRWFGNSLRATYRARRLPVSITTPYIWYLIRDQRITMWTGLYGLCVSILAELKWGGGIFLAYIWWVLFSRFMVTLYYGIERNVYYLIWILLLYYNQIIGSLVKIYILSHLYRQKWTRQKTEFKLSSDILNYIYVRLTSNIEMILKLALFVVIVNYTLS